MSATTAVDLPIGNPPFASAFLDVYSDALDVAFVDLASFPPSPGDSLSEMDVRSVQLTVAPGASDTVSLFAAAAPEPSSMRLLGAGLPGLVVARLGRLRR